MKEQIKQLAASLLPEIIGFRRHIHAHPELSFQEKNTAAFVAKQLSKWGIAFEENVGGFGISAVIQGKGEGKTIALRADMDALPIEELNDVAYKSTAAGVMHACGHDVHTASLLGAAYILHALRDQWNGSVQLIFQPAEEVLPGGASIMIKDGVFEKTKPECIFGQHVFPELPAGKVGFCPGPYMASTDELYVTVKGVGGHGAKPDKAVDPVLISAHLIVALQQVASRWTNPMMPTVLTFGKVQANGATNIIPGEVRLEGTFRTFDEKWRFEAHQRMIKLAQGLVESMGGQVDFRIEVGYPVVMNDVELTQTAKKMAIEYLGSDNVVNLEQRTTAEDFAYYSQIMPGCFYRLGTTSPDGKNFTASVHNARFDVDESSLETGMGLMAWLALSSLLHYRI